MVLGVHNLINLRFLKLVWILLLCVLVLLLLLLFLLFHLLLFWVDVEVAVIVEAHEARTGGNEGQGHTTEKNFKIKSQKKIVDI